MTKRYQKSLFQFKHGAARVGAKTRTYKTWASMIARCTIPSATGYPQYGGAGVVVCERWRYSFENFLADMGEAPDGMSLDRYPVSDGNYEPDNCRWATRLEQNENRRSVRWIEHNGVRLTVTSWARRLGISQAAMQERIAKWPLLQAIGVEPRPPQVRVPPPPMTPQMIERLRERNRERSKTAPRAHGRFTK